MLTAVGVNFREVTAAGLRPGTLFRCGAVPTYTDRDATAMRDRHGIRTLVDLRVPRDLERYGEPKAIADAGIRWVNVSFTGYGHRPIGTARPSSADYTEYYRGMLRETPREYWGALFATFADAAREPFAVCCHVGKDRTGVLVAGILSVLGCPPGDIARDYAAGAAELVAHVDLFEDKWSKRGHTRDDYLTRMHTVPDTMAGLLEWADAEYGGFARFLADRTTPADLRRLRERLGAA